jgi:aldose 1-epimerase
LAAIRDHKERPASDALLAAADSHARHHGLDFPVGIVHLRVTRYKRGNVMRALCGMIFLLSLCVPAAAGVTRGTWGVLPGGEPVHLFTLTSSSGIQAQITDFGGRVVSLKVPDRAGRMANIVQGFETFEPYRTDSSQYGALIGRYANRIAGAQFTLNGHVYHLVTTGHALVQSHGGPNGYFQRVWDARGIDGKDPRRVLSLFDPDGEMGFPGNLRVTVTYTLMKDRLRIEYRAVTDKDTVVNLTNHSYFTLSGGTSATVDDQVLQVFADRYVPADKTGMPLGDIRAVGGTDFDFRKPARLGPRLASSSEQMSQENGLDHSFVVNGRAGSLRQAARLTDPKSGRVLEVWTTQPGVQIYTANFVSRRAVAERHYQPHSAVAFEAQHYPNSPNQPNFPSTLVSPAKPLHEVTEFRFKTVP